MSSSREALWKTVIWTVVMNASQTITMDQHIRYLYSMCFDKRHGRGVAVQTRGWSSHPRARLHAVCAVCERRAEGRKSVVERHVEGARKLCGRSEDKAYRIAELTILCMHHNMLVVLPILER